MRDPPRVGINGDRIIVPLQASHMHVTVSRFPVAQENAYALQTQCEPRMLRVAAATLLSFSSMAPGKAST